MTSAAPPRFDWASQPDLQAALLKPRKWLVTGAAGFIGSNLVEALLMSGQIVRGLDNFATGHRHNLDLITQAVGKKRIQNFEFVEADIRDYDTCLNAMSDQSLVLHNAALGSVPRSIADPITTHSVNVSGFINMLEAARHSQIDRFVYAASSSTYGDHPALPKREDRIGAPLSPYAATKFFNEIYADIYGRTYDLATTGLRYFNVFGPRQDPVGAYAAVIPKWLAAMASNQEVSIYGNGETSRDFCYVDNAVQANIRAALCPSDARTAVYNVAVGDRTSLNTLFTTLQKELARYQKSYTHAPNYQAFRKGDVKHSQADINKIQKEIGYQPTHDFKRGIQATVRSYLAKIDENRASFS